MAIRSKIPLGSSAARVPARILGKEFPTAGPPWTVPETLLLNGIQLSDRSSFIDPAGTYAEDAFGKLIRSTGSGWEDVVGGGTGSVPLVSLTDPETGVTPADFTGQLCIVTNDASYVRPFICGSRLGSEGNLGPLWMRMFTDLDVGQTGGIALAEHAHGMITSAGFILGYTDNFTNEVFSPLNAPLITDGSGAINPGKFGTAAGTFCAGDDARIEAVSSATASPTINTIVKRDDGAGSVFGSVCFETDDGHVSVKAMVQSGTTRSLSIPDLGSGVATISLAGTTLAHYGITDAVPSSRTIGGVDLSTNRTLSDIGATPIDHLRVIATGGGFSFTAAADEDGFKRVELGRISLPANVVSAGKIWVLAGKMKMARLPSGAFSGFMFSLGANASGSLLSTGLGFTGLSDSETMLYCGFAGFLTISVNNLSGSVGLALNFSTGIETVFNTLPQIAINANNPIRESPSDMGVPLGQAIDLVLYAFTADPSTLLGYEVDLKLILG